MQQHEPREKKCSLWVRYLALIAALIVILGSVMAFVLPRIRESSALPGAGVAYAESTEKPWKDLKRGVSGGNVLLAQRGLTALGYYDGKLDGNFSKVFEEAVLAFQRDFGLEENGVLDQEAFLLITEDLPQDSPAPTKAASTPRPAATAAPGETETAVSYGEAYSDKEHVAAYLRAFGELPPNYITKQEATALGWVNSRGNLWIVAPGKSIGGDRFGNYEGQLPAEKGRKYFECDIDYDPNEDQGRRNAKRIIYSSDGLIFYTEDHYQTFEEITQP